MDLRWLLPSLALALPVAAQEAPSEPQGADATAPSTAPAAAASAPPSQPAGSAQDAPTAAPRAVSDADAPKPSAPPSDPPASGERAPEPRPKAATAAPAPTPVAETAGAPAASGPATDTERPSASAPPTGPDRPAAGAPAATARPPAPPPAAPAATSPVIRPTQAHGSHGHSHGPSDLNDLVKNTEGHTDAQRVERMARAAFERLLAGDARFVVQGSAFPFYLDGRRYEDRETLFQELLQQLRSRRLDLLTLQAIEVFTPAEMEKRHGPPPARLAQLPWKAPQTWIAVGNLSGRPAVALFQNGRNGWKLVAFTD